MKRKTIVHESSKAKMGRPRSVSDNDLAPAISVRLPPTVLVQVEAWAAKKGVKRSDAIRDMVTYAIAGRMIDSAKASKRGKR
jgi:hypothetical protein